MLSASRRRFLRSRSCRLLLWLLAACLVLGGMSAVAQPLGAPTTKAPVSACHGDMQHAAAAHADSHGADCCHGGNACFCAGAHALGETSALRWTGGAPAASPVASLRIAGFAGRHAPPPLRPPIA